ncbi:hypothetical protein AB6A40_006396 [Gnathostoma spinigerum]|uniref:EF-hand domain-containing protein n=1 Tax=Gnathostoma spinigerum TaxID=75299 RepID=A0ABD6ET23_9BILA
MGNGKSILTDEYQIRDLAHETGFTRNQVNKLSQRFKALDKEGRGYLIKEDLLCLPDLKVNPLGERIVEAFFSNTKSPEQMVFSEFLKVMACFRPVRRTKSNILNSRTEKLKFAFAMYDLNKNGYITREECRIVLDIMTGSILPPNQLDQITDRIILEADIEQDGQISFVEYCKAMEKIDVEHKMSIRFDN